MSADLKCDVCGVGPRPTQAIYCIGNKRLCIKHVDELATTPAVETERAAVGPRAFTEPREVETLLIDLAEAYRAHAMELSKQAKSGQWWIVNGYADILTRAIRDIRRHERRSRLCYPQLFTERPGSTPLPPMDVSPMQSDLITRQDDPQLTHLQKQGFVDCYLRNWVNGGKYERSHSLNVGVALNQAWQLFEHYDAVRIALDAALVREAEAEELRKAFVVSLNESGEFLVRITKENTRLEAELADALECEKRLSTALLYMKREYAAFGSLSQETQNMATAALAKENTPHA